MEFVGATFIEGGAEDDDVAALVVEADDAAQDGAAIVHAEMAVGVVAAGELGGDHAVIGDGGVHDAVGGDIEGDLRADGHGAAGGPQGTAEVPGPGDGLGAGQAEEQGEGEEE